MEIIKQRFAEHIMLARQVADSDILEQVAASAAIIKQALRDGKKVLFCGNGGSAAVASIWRRICRAVSKRT